MTISILSRRHVFISLVFICFLVESVYYLKDVKVEEKLPEVNLTQVEEIPLPGDMITEFVPPFIPIVNDYAVASGYNLLGCNIRKSMSQLSFNIVCYLNNTEAFLNNNQTLLDTWKVDRVSCPEIFWTTYNPLFKSGALKLSQFTKFAFIRHPEQRFASFFLDKCKRSNSCNNCRDLMCASKMVYERLMTVARNPTKFVKDDPAMWFEWHAAPQTWNCDFHENLADFHLIPIGTSSEERKIGLEKLRRVLQFAGVPEQHIEKVVSDAETGDTAHATYESEESESVLREIRENPIIRNYLLHTYYHDYVAFGFNMTGIVSY